MSKRNSEPTFEQLRPELKPLPRSFRENARLRYEVVKSASRNDPMWRTNQVRWDENRRRGPVPPLCDFDPLASGVDWWREQS